MSTPKSRARWVRGALVGACSAVVTVGRSRRCGRSRAPGRAVDRLDAGVRNRRRRDWPPRRSKAAAVACSVSSVRSPSAQSLGHLTLMASAAHHHSDIARSHAIDGRRAPRGRRDRSASRSLSVEYLYVVCDVGAVLAATVRDGCARRPDCAVPLPTGAQLTVVAHVGAALLRSRHARAAARHSVAGRIAV